MFLRVYAFLIGAAVLVGGFLVLGESPAASPGPISSHHEDLASDCRSCHAPFQDVSDGCESCHGELAPQNAHRDAGLRCADCHREHRGESVSLNEPAREACSGCHAHDSIQAVAAHAVGGEMERPVDPASHKRAGADAFRTFSHVAHFEEADTSDDPNCKSCHFVGEKAEALAGSEQVVLWSSCEECHDDWTAAGFARADAEHARSVALDLDRFERVAFTHSEEHLEADCESCHTAIRDAGALAPEDGKGDRSVARLATCFGCHVHQPEGVAWATPARESADSDYAPGSAVACAGCHQFHGAGEEAEIVAEPTDEEPRPPGWDRWLRTAKLSFTPWLLLFLGLGGTGWVVAWRRLPEIRRSSLAADSNVAPQRVAEVPVLSPTGESSVSGLYIIGELAGIPLVNRAMKSGFDVADIIENRLRNDPGAGAPGGELERPPEERFLDLLIAGSGPAGLGAATRAQSLGLSYVLCEKSTAAATIRDYPRAKIIQAAPVEIPDYGSFFQEEDESKEALVRRWEDIISRTGVVIREREEIVDIEPHAEGGFAVEIAGGKRYRTRNVVLAIGMRGTPRRLKVPGESPDRVAYNLIDADEYREQDLLVVGGGNAAVEAALALSQPELLNRVHLAIRGPVLKGITPQNSKDIDAAAAEGQLEIIPSCSMVEIREGVAVLETPDGPRELPNDKIFALIGAELPIPFLRKIGVRLAKKGL